MKTKCYKQLYMYKWHLPVCGVAVMWMKENTKQVPHPQWWSLFPSHRERVVFICRYKIHTYY